MRYLTMIVLGSIFLLIGCAPKVDLEAEKAKVKEVLDLSIKASETEDMELLSKVYAHDSDIISIGTAEDERLVGWNSLKELMQRQFDSTETTKTSVHNQVIKVNNTGTTAWFSEVINWELIVEEQTVTIDGLRATGVLEKRDGNWVIVQIHYSLPCEV